MIGVISYLPETLSLREHRFNCLKQVIEYWHKILPDEKISIVAQSFTTGDIDKLIEITDKVCVYKEHDLR